MSGQAIISIRFNMDELIKEPGLLEARSTIYGAVSSLFADPESEKFSIMLKDQIQGSVLDACFQMEKSMKGSHHNLSHSFQVLMTQLADSHLIKIRREFVDVFGHTLSKKIAPYALEHLKNTDVFFRTQKLADLNGFYKAFGIEVQSIERADHISTQTEFLSYLLLKERLAERDGLMEEMDVCREAFENFKKDHFLDWAGMFSENLADKVDGDFYNLCGKFLHTFIDCEKISKTTTNNNFVKN